MKVHDVVVLREVAADLNEGKAFYDRSEPGASTVSTECSPSGFPTPFTTR